MNQKEIVLECSNCHGSGVVGHGEDQIKCFLCKGYGSFTIDREYYFRKLRWDQKNMREHEKE